MLHAVRQDSLIGHYEIRRRKVKVILGSLWGAGVFEIIFNITLSFSIPVFSPNHEDTHCGCCFSPFLLRRRGVCGEVKSNQSDKTTVQLQAGERLLLHVRGPVVDQPSPWLFS